MPQSEKNSSNKNEIGFIKDIFSSFPRCKKQKNRIFESDAEVFECGGLLMAVTTDEFSGAEDGFKDSDKEVLGWNLAVATISDLLATGAEPRYFLHVLGLPENEPEAFARGVAKGIRKALDESGSFLLGGDLSADKNWSYVGTAIGIIDKKPLFRTTKSEELYLYATGSFGDGNLSALHADYQARFELRKSFMQKAADFVEIAMDTSDGLKNTLHTICMLNPTMQLIASVDDLKIHEDVLNYCKVASLSPKAFLLGSAGEYELIVGVKPEHKEQFEASCTGEPVQAIGTMKACDTPGFFWKNKKENKCKADIEIKCDPRLESDREIYIKEVLSVAQQLFG